MQAVTTLTNEIKSRAKKLFKQAFNLNKLVVTVKDIKAVFPAFDGRKAVHWMNLIDKCLEKLFNAENVYEFSDRVMTTLQAEGEVRGIQVCLQDVTPFRARCYTKDSKGCLREIGSIYCHKDSQGVDKFSITWTSRMNFKDVANHRQAFAILLNIFKSHSNAA